MQSGKDYVYECPQCGNFIKRPTLLSGNPFRSSRLFSDGKRISPMCPEFPNLTKCKKCSAIFFLYKLKEVQVCHSDSDVNSPWHKSESAVFLTIEDYVDAINTEVAEDKGEELFIRQSLWWAYNDRKRKDLKLFTDKSDKLRYMENLQKLEPLFDLSDIDERILVAEIRRNLGDFETCLSILESIEDENTQWVKEALIKECMRKNRYVIQLVEYP